MRIRPETQKISYSRKPQYVPPFLLQVSFLHNIVCFFRGKERALAGLNLKEWNWTTNLCIAALAPVPLYLQRANWLEGHFPKYFYLDVHSSTIALVNIAEAKERALVGLSLAVMVYRPHNSIFVAFCLCLIMRF